VKEIHTIQETREKCKSVTAYVVCDYFAFGNAVYPVSTLCDSSDRVEYRPLRLFFCVSNLRVVFPFVSTK
jgi:hypothetical protein